MKLCRFDENRLGLVEHDQVFDVSGALSSLVTGPWPFPPGDVLIRQLDAIKSAVQIVRRQAKPKPLNEVGLHSLITTPSKIIAAPANYALHVQIDAQDPGVNHGFHNKLLEGVDRPVEKFGLFLKASSSIVGPSDGIALHWLDRRNDHEVELAAVIGREGKNISAANALSYIAGYMVGLDMTVRGTEDRSYRKSADSYTVVGPWLTTADEIADPHNLEIWLSVNGQQRQRSSTGVMTVPIAELIEIASRAYTLYPGDIILTGSPEGVSQIFPGDIIRAGGSSLGDMQVVVRAA
jgi:2,4-diketo-3-deoxy-L-fuconate hydrolase